MAPIAIIAFAQRFNCERYWGAMNGPMPCPAHSTIDRVLRVRDHLRLAVA